MLAVEARLHHVVLLCANGLIQHLDFQHGEPFVLLELVRVLVAFVLELEGGLVFEHLGGFFVVLDYLFFFGLQRSYFFLGGLVLAS